MNQPDKLVLAPTNRCTARCNFCYYDGEYAGDVELDVARRVLDEFDFRVIELSGIGEPLLYGQFPVLVEMAAGYGADLRLVSNAQLLGRYIDLVADNFDTAWFSLNAATSGTYAKIGMGDGFDAVCDAISQLAGRSKRPSIRLSFLPTVNNWMEMEDFVLFATDLGADRITIQALDAMLNRQKYWALAPPLEGGFGRALHRIQKDERVSVPPEWVFYPGLYERPRPVAIRCGCAEGNFGLYLVDGSVTPCCYMAAERKSLGNIHQQSLQDIWCTTQQDFSIRLRTGHIPPLCRSCLNYWNKELL